jgi:hypothetical protein
MFCTKPSNPGKQHVTAVVYESEASVSCVAGSAAAQDGVLSMGLKVQVPVEPEQACTAFPAQGLDLPT